MAFASRMLHRPALLVFLPFLLAASSRATGEELSASDYEKAKAASVEILVNGHLNGSGFLADPKGLVMTAAHVIESPDRKLEIRSPSLGRKDARFVAIDLGHDLALLSIEPRKEVYPILKLAEKYPPPGAKVFILGAPIYRHNVLAPGGIAGTETAFEYYPDRFNEVMHIAATVPRGMSGGVWISTSGDVVGLQSGVMSQNSIPIGIAFVCPLGAMRTLLERRKSASTPSLGLVAEELWTQDRKVIDRYPPRTEGLVITSLSADGPAARAGLKDSDIIVAADGKRVRLIAELMRIACSKQPGQTLELTILRPDGAGQSKATLNLGKLEVAWP
jgi:S1-C subfamily serine protease